MKDLQARLVEEVHYGLRDLLGLCDLRGLQGNL